MEWCFGAQHGKYGPWLLRIWLADAFHGPRWLRRLANRPKPVGPKDFPPRNDHLAGDSNRPDWASGDEISTALSKRSRRPAIDARFLRFDGSHRFKIWT
jgi:hypothetical protein